MSGSGPDLTTYQPGFGFSGKGRDARNPEGVSTEVSTLSGFSVPLEAGPGTQLRSGSRSRNKFHCCVVRENHFVGLSTNSGWPEGPPVSNKS